MHTVVHGDGAFARVMRKTAAFGASIERQNGIGAQGAKAHGRDVEHAGLVRLRGIRANGDAKVVRCQLGGRHRVVHPFVALAVDGQLRAKRTLVRLALGTLVHQRALGTRERRGLAVTFNKVLANFRTDELQYEAQVPNDGVVAQDGTLVLAQVVHARGQQPGKQHQPKPARAKNHQGKQAQQQAETAGRQGHKANRKNGIEEFQHQGSPAQGA